uniref:Serine/threonine-protein kinase SMU1 (EC) n=1 Tax=Ganoderma boninense TaxID=34458 RepID=A0A5K1K1R8_9APHY|nr:Serine/threonine-protein kinase SMU1 (EC [Ganoderma boninense]
MDSTYFTAQALYQFSARALGMAGPSPHRREIASSSSEVSDSQAMDIEPAGNPTGVSLTFSSTSMSMQASAMAPMPNIVLPTIPGGFSFSSPAPNTPPPHMYPINIPSSPSSFHDVPQSSRGASESSAKVRRTEMPSLRVQGLKRRLRATEAKLLAASQKHQRDRQRLAIETAHKASTMQYAQDLAAWEQRAQSYEQQLRAQESRLLAVTAENAAITKELREALHMRGEQLASLQRSLHGKDVEMSHVQVQCQELIAKFEAVQLELRKEKDTAGMFQAELGRERESAAVEREREMLALEERMTRTIQATYPAPPRASEPAPLESETTSLRQASNPPNIPAPSLPAQHRPSALARQSSTAPAFTVPRSSTPSAASVSRQRPPPIPSDESSESSDPPEHLSGTPDDFDFEDIPERQPSTLPPDRVPRLAVPRHAQAKVVAKVVAAEKAAIGARSEDRKEHLKQVRAVFGEFLGAPEDEDFVSGHTPASRDVVEAYLNGAGLGPDRNDLCFTDLKPYNNAWNCAVASELGDILFTRQSSGKWRRADGTQVATASQPYWADAVLEKFKRQATSWRDAMGRVVANGLTGVPRKESRAETNTRRLQQGEEQAKVARQRERRAKRWDRRKAICKAAINFATTTFDENQWKKFLQIIDTLGKEGMSSDESDEDVTHLPCYRVSILPWRREFDAIMDKIDAERLNPKSGYSKRGSRPTPRHRQDKALEGADDIRVSRREAVSGLPSAFYDAQWLKGLSNDYVERVLSVSEEVADWVVEIANLYGTSST